MDPAALVDVVRLTGVGKRYRGVWAARDISLEVRRGEIYGVIGPDGAGKSSLLKAIAGVLAHDAGSIDVFGTRITSERSAERIKGRLGFMPQGLGLNLYGELSVDENVDFFARLRLVPRAVLAERKRQLLEMTRLRDVADRPAKHLSGGMKQKLGLVCTLIHEPDLLVLDEPTTGVDPVSRRDFWAILGQMARERAMTAIISTSYMDEVARFDRVALLHAGGLLAQGAPAAISAMLPGSIVGVRVDPQRLALERLRATFEHVEALGAWLRVRVPDEDHDAALHTVAGVLAGLRIEAIESGAAEPEDVLVSLTREEALPPRAHTEPRDADRSRSVAPATLLVEAKGLVRDFDRFRAVDDVSFSVRAGEIFGLLGANGAGKTTVIKMLTGLIVPTAGIARVAGNDMRRAAPAVRSRIGYMSQAFSLYADLTVAENIALAAGVYGLNRRETRERTAWVNAMAGLEWREGIVAGRLPAGLRQRLALGCALVHRPEVLFLDEPTSGVDPAGRHRFWEIIFALARAEGVAVVLSTHYMTEADHCDRVALLFDGRVVADASPESLKRQLERDTGRRGVSMDDVFVERVTALERARQAPPRTVAPCKRPEFLASPPRKGGCSWATAAC
jgi:ABC-type multidrug transport system ATPase subunit